MSEYLLWGTLLALLTTVPLAWKWQLGVLRVACATAGLALAVSFLVAQIGSGTGNVMTRSVLVWVLAVAAAFCILLYRFHRDPQRIAPNNDSVIVSPADGVVIYVYTSERGVLPVSSKKGRDYPLVELTNTPLQSEDAVVIGISMNFLDVHVNRAPIRGRVTFQNHFPGRFGSLRQPEMVFENERATTVIEHAGFQVAIVQIASRLVRQIVSFVSAGQDVALGQRIGVIRFGSQVDVVLPVRDDLDVAVRPGQRVRAGESILAKLAEAGKIL